MALLENSIVRILVLLLAIIGVGFGGLKGLNAVQLRSAKKVMKLALDKGYPAVAADTAENRRELLANDGEGCALMIDAFFRARIVTRLDWASQMCMANGLNIVETFLGLSAVRSFEGRDQEAINVLQEGLRIYPDSAPIYVRMAEIFRKNKNENLALQAFVTAVQKAPTDLALALNAYQYFQTLKKTELMKQLAQRMKTAETTQPEVKLVIARTLKETGDMEGSKQLASQGLALAAKNPQLVAALSKSYADVVGGAAPAPAAPEAKTKK